MSKKGIVILGVGRWGVHFVRNFLHHPQVNLIAIVDSSENNLIYCQEKFNLDRLPMVLATDWEAVRELHGIDGVVVATPATSHYKLVLDALNLGYHVLCEKPLTLNPSECLELTRLAEQKKRLLLIDHIYLFHPAIERGRQLLQSSQLGQLRYGYASRTHLGPVRQDVDALWDLAIHDLSIFNDWLGQVPIEVQATGKTWLQSTAKSPHFPGGLADLVWVTLTYPDGFQAYLHFCWLNPDKQRKLAVVGTQGSLIFDEMSLETPLMIQQGFLQSQGEQFQPMGQGLNVVEIEKAEPLKRVCDHFLAAMDSPNLASFSSGLVATQLVQILSCLSLSLQRQGEVITVPYIG